MVQVGRTGNMNDHEGMPARPLRVLLVNDHLGYAQGVIHGVSRYFMALAGQFDPRQVEIHLCILRPHHPAAEVLEAAGIRPIFLGLSKWDPRALSRLVGLLDDLEIDLLHLSGLKGCLLGRIAARLRRRPAIIHFHDTTPIPPIIRFFQRWLSPWTARALAISEPVRQFGIEQFKLPADLVEMLPYGLVIEEFATPSPEVGKQVRRELSIDPDAPVIGVMSRLVFEKGHETLLRAMVQIRRSHPRIVLLVAGDGERRLYLEDLARDLELGESVRFAGFRQDVTALLGAVDLVAVPSLEEGFGMVALEALAAGRAVVASDVGGLPMTVIHERTGLLCPKGDVKALAGALCRILGDSELARTLARNGRHHAENFTVERHVQRLAKIYQEMQKARARGQ